MVTDRDAANVVQNDPSHPFDPRCLRFARDMNDYDCNIQSDLDDLPGALQEPTPEMRERYVIEQEGTYNHANGHFLCDGCYIHAGAPSRPFPTRWVCP